MKRNSLVLTALLLAFAMLLTGCSLDRTEAADTYTVYMVVKSTNTEFWLSVFAGANAAKSEYNVDLVILGPETEEEYEKQNEYIHEAIDSGADAIVFSAISYTGNAEAIDAAAKAGLKIVVIDSDVDSDLVSARIGTDNVQAGRMTGTAVLNTDRTEINVGIVNFDLESRNGQEREMGLRETLEGDERVGGVYTVNVAADAEAARRGAELLMKEHPEINVLVGLNEPLAVGVGLAAADVPPGTDLRVVGFDTNVKCVEMMRDGTMSALIAQNPYAMGYLGVETAWNLLEGQSYNSDEWIDTATTIIDEENMFSAESQKMLFPFG